MKVRETGYYKAMRRTLLGLVAVLTLGGTTSCDRLHEDLEPCPQGLRLRFVYDYNMEFANAFPSQVDCLTVLFYDGNGKFVAKETRQGGELADENWRMTVDLPAGDYDILAYGGMECSMTDFHFVTEPEATSYTDIKVELNNACRDVDPGKNLHPLFYGNLSASVSDDDTDYREATVKMMRDTHNVRILLQQTTPDVDIDVNDFTFRIIDNNTLFAYNNDIIPQQEVNYYPWTKGNSSVGSLPDGDKASVAYAEISFPRLIAGNPSRLLIERKSDGMPVIDIPLNNYLLLLKSQQFSEMGGQEYLDRETRWNMIFFLDRDQEWIKTQIVINDWVVRINDIEM